MWASQRNEKNEKVVELLLEKEGIDVNARDNVRPTPSLKRDRKRGWVGMLRGVSRGVSACLAPPELGILLDYKSVEKGVKSRFFAPMVGSGKGYLRYKGSHGMVLGAC